MSLSREEIESLMRLIGQTHDREITCEECLALVAEFAERRLAGRTIPDGLRAIEYHLSSASDRSTESRSTPCPSRERCGRVSLRACRIGSTSGS